MLTPTPNLRPPKIWMFSHAARLPDWAAAISAQPRHVGLILRDYEHENRAQLAADMAALCRQQNRRFAIAGDAKLARTHGAAFHCPSYLLRQPAKRCGAPQAGDMAATHNAPQIIAAHLAGFGCIFISPIFATNSHAGQKPLGVLRAQNLFRLADNLGLKAYALGGMTRAHFHRLKGAPAKGWAAIDYFAS